MTLTALTSGCLDPGGLTRHPGPPLLPKMTDRPLAQPKTRDKSIDSGTMP